MSGICYYIADVETNGIKPGYHEINEISIIRCKDRHQLTEFIKCENPERSSREALIIIKKSREDLLKGSAKETSVEKIEKFLNEDGTNASGRCIIGHNVSFDMRFLHALWASCNKEFPANLWLDTMSMSRAYAKREGIIKPKVNLHAACDMLGIKKISEAHASKVDSRNTYFLHQALVEREKIDYLPFIKTAVHSIKSTEEECGLDPDLLDYD